MLNVCFCEETESQNGRQQSQHWEQFAAELDYTVGEPSECAGLSFRLNPDHRTPPRLWISLVGLKT